MLSPLPRRSGWAHFAHSLPAISAFPERVTGSACASSFSRFARRSLTLRPAHSRRHQIVTRYTEGFGYFVTSIAAPVASGWSVRRVGLAPTGKRRLSTAHTQLRHQRSIPISEFIKYQAAGSLAFDVGLANDAAILVILLAKMSGEIRSAHPDREEIVGGKLRLNFGSLNRRAEPACKL